MNPLATLSAERLARWEGRLRPLLTRLPARLAIPLYSRGRRAFLERLVAERPERPVFPSPELARTLWGIEFRAPLLNAAGMFKNGRGYDLVARQGAGGYLAGTTTALPRAGNPGQPFAPYPRSGAASNFLGLPNDGHEAVAARLAKIERAPGCPVGASLAAIKEPGSSDPDGLGGLLRGLETYDRAGVDFLEINESCPNTGEEALDHSGLAERLGRIAEDFLARRSRPLPVLVKFSLDTDIRQVESLVDLVVDLGFDGMNFGNTSVDYGGLRDAIHPAEQGLYRTFTDRHGGGVSGRPVRQRSLELCQLAAHRLARRSAYPGLPRQFHLVRTGGIDSAHDLTATAQAGAALSGWYTGYFEAFARHGHGLYRELFEELDALPVSL